MPSEKSKQLAKNATLLYVRQFIVIIISFFTSRVVLQALGVSDYGVFTLVGGIIVMMSFMNSILAGAASRFLTYDLGLGNTEKMSTTFNTVFYAYVVLAAFFLVVSETVGLWIVNTQLVIPEGRLFAANVIYQVSVVSAVLGITQAPYSATIVAHEHFGIYAYMSMGVNAMRLAIAIATLYVPFDHLIFYGVLYVCVSIGDILINRIYCIRRFPESHLRRVFDKQLFKQMLSFSSWNFLGSTSGTLAEQLRNIFINRFFGTLINAAVGVATQVLGVVFGFIITVIQAFRPQIVKEYARGDYHRVNQLVQMGSKFASIITLTVTIPMFVKLEFLMNLWLVEVPQGALVISQIFLINNLFKSFYHIIAIAIEARGQIKTMQLWMTAINISACVVFYLTLRITHSYAAGFIVNCIWAVVLYVLEQTLLKRYMPEFDSKSMFWRTVVPTLLTAAGSYFIIHQVDSLIPNDFLALIVDCLLSILIVGFVAYHFMLDKYSRGVALNFIKSKLPFKK